MNKLALDVFPLPRTLMMVQFASSAATALREFAYVGERPAAPSARYARWLALIVTFFCLSIVTNMLALRASSVDLVVLFRALAVFPLALVDYAALGRRLPSASTALALAGLVAGSALVLRHGRQLELVANGLGWLTAYLAVIVVDSVVVKRFVHSAEAGVAVRSRVLWVNLASCAPAAAFAYGTGEWSAAGAPRDAHTAGAIFPVAAACALGAVLSYAAWALRQRVSTLSFTVVCLVNKIASVLLNAAFFSAHLPPRSVLLGIVSLATAALYTEPKEQKEGEEAEVDPLEPRKKRILAGALLMLIALIEWTAQ